MTTLTIENYEIVRRTPKALLIAFPKGSEREDYAVWFPKSKVSFDGKKATINLIGSEYQLVLRDTIIIAKEELASLFGSTLVEE